MQAEKRDIRTTVPIATRSKIIIQKKVFDKKIKMYNK